MMWVAYLMLALEILVIVLGLLMMWVMMSEAFRASVDPSSPVEHPTEHSPAQALEYPPQAKDQDPPLQEEEDEVFPALFTVKEADELGYVSSRKLHMGCEAAVCRTPFGARIVSGRRSLKEPQYAWDYASVRLAEKALVYAEFNTHPSDGIVGVEDFGRGCYAAAEPQNYFRRWRYTAEGQMERF
jgi:hypothetical protein